MDIRIAEEIQGLYEEVKEIYRKLHREPELGFNVHKTASFVAQYLRDLGLEVTEGIGRTGVVGILRGEGSCIMFRADMDALSIQEDNDLPFKSINPGMMHACGHDSHTAMLLVAAKVLSKTPNLKGTIKFVFQPSEEALPGGAIEMINDGVLDNVDEVYGIHVGKPLNTGDYLYNTKYASMSCDKFEVKIIGKGGHGSCPESTKDPIPVAASMIQLFSNISANRQRPIRCQTNIVKTSDTFNAIPTNVTLVGSTRSLVPEDRDYIEKRMKTIVRGFEVAHNMKIDINYERGYGSVVNNEKCGNWCLKTIESITSGKRYDEIIAFSEDFSYFSDRKPGAFLVLGCGLSEFGNHTSRFFIDEQVLLIGVSYWVELAKNRLSGEVS
ncbi:hypothetical protein SteCoe_5007 [Stentor coeruleus]|uniref:Peptidase M20 dimerisation domain-containing protein n=1 Tax=Stentor coeruleus TaxID=5963 RepID=A0A1R2CT89_9CILI|nr:hypothetical protein SteCoe_5007 [Stentor coeruleus]